MQYFTCKGRVSDGYVFAYVRTEWNALSFMYLENRKQSPIKRLCFAFSDYVRGFKGVKKARQLSQEPAAGSRAFISTG